MDWHTPTLADIESMQACAANNKLYGNNYSSVNSFLYSTKYNSKIAIENNWLFEKYTVNRTTVFSCPHNINGNNEGLKNAILKLAGEAKLSGEKLTLRNLLPTEKNSVLELFPQALVQPAPELGDYIYLTENLSSLPGSKYSKKRNHINQFSKKHPDFHFEPLCKENLNLALKVEEKWLGAEKDEDLLAELKIIKMALENFESLENICGMTGGILLVENEPVAFCIASTLNSELTDIHFEKCIAPFAQDGGYAVINREFAKTLSTRFINREEDLGIEGLKKAKLSYYPEQVLEKFVLTFPEFFPVN